MATPFPSNLALANPISAYNQAVRKVQRAIGELPADSGADPDRAALGAVDAVEPPLQLSLGAEAERL
jgi:hypothetical protein